MSKQLFRTVFWITLFWGWVVGIEAEAQSESLLGLYEAGREAFLSQHYREAVEHFQSLENQFASEAEFEAPGFQMFFYSMFGMSALLADDVGLARSKLGVYMARFYEHRNKDAIVLLGLIQATRKLEAFEELDQWYEKFLWDYPEHPDHFLIRFERMMTLFERNKLSEGMEEVERIWNASAPKDLRFRVRLIGIQQLMLNGDSDEAGRLLLNTKWEIARMPEMAVLAVSSLKLGEYFMERQEWGEAIRAFRWVPFYQALVDTQRGRLRSLEQKMDDVGKAESFFQSPLWKAHYEHLIAQVSARLVQLEQGVDYTPAFLLKYGRCYLFSEQYAEAWVIFRSLALTPGIDAAIEEQAWYHWILSSHGAENWEEARELCVRFSESFPGSALLPKTLYMLARTYQESGDLIRANQVLTDLLQRYPGHEDNASWWITRGFNLASLNDNEAALVDFDTAIGHSKITRALLVRARYWKGVTLSALARYDTAIEVFRALILEYPDHWMNPEFQYRLASVHYSKRDYEIAKGMLNAFISSHPDHIFIPEAKVLLGDVAMGCGELDHAIDLFAAIETTDAQLYMYAYFQIGKIYRAREAYGRMERHFRDYIDGPHFHGKARTSEALYWLGWALSQLDREYETIPLYLTAIHAFGNHPQEGELIPMIRALEVQKKKLMSEKEGGEARALAAVPGARAFYESESFEAWLVGAMEAAKSDELMTYYARLQLYEALKLRRQKEPELARKGILGISLITPIEALDDQLLGEIGLSLAEDGFDSALDYLRRLLIVYPQSPFKALAYYGLGQHACKHGQWQDALKWLSLFEKETPSHPHSIDVRLLRAQVLVELAQYQQATEAYNDLLRLKAARGFPHVKAILGLAQLHERKGDAPQAIPYYQRLYTLYRAYRPTVAKAYLQSARLFEDIGEIMPAYRTLVEFTQQRDLLEFAEYTTAIGELERMETAYREVLFHVENPTGEPVLGSLGAKEGVR